jgi:hypothetical protein
VDTADPQRRRGHRHGRRNVLPSGPVPLRQTGVDDAGHAKGHFEACGVRPQLLERISAEGISLPLEMFRQRILPTHKP